MEFSRQEYWSRLPFPSLGDLPNPGIELKSPALQADSLPPESTCYHIISLPKKHVHSGALSLILLGLGLHVVHKMSLIFGRIFNNIFQIVRQLGSETIVDIFYFSLNL